MPAPKSIRKSKSPTNAVLEERLESQCVRIDEIKEDVQNRSSELKSDINQVLTVVNNLALTVAKLPTWDNVKEIHTETRKVVKEQNEAQNTSVLAIAARVTELEDNKKTIVGGWKTVCAIGAGAVALFPVISWLWSFVPSLLPHK